MGALADAIPVQWVYALPGGLYWLAGPPAQTGDTGNPLTGMRSSGLYGDLGQGSMASAPPALRCH